MLPRASYFCSYHILKSSNTEPTHGNVEPMSSRAGDLGKICVCQVNLFVYLTIYFFHYLSFYFCQESELLKYEVPEYIINHGIVNITTLLSLFQSSKVKSE